MSKDKEIKISMAEYVALRNAQNKLEALEGAGVDNWEGYDYAMDEYVEEDESELLADNSNTGN